YPLPYDCTLENLVQDVLEGTLYEKWQRQIGAETRDQAKAAFFHLVYGNAKDNPNLQAMVDLYPGPAQAILDLKREKGYKWVAQEMQRRESGIMINAACQYLMKHQPEVPILTVHDSILTTQENLDLVTNII